MPLFRRKEEYGFRNKRSIGSILSAPFQGLMNLLSGSDDELGQQVSVPKRIWRQLVRLVVFPFWFLFQILKFIVLSWTTTRNGSAALWGMIPLLVIMGILGIEFVTGFIEGRLTRSLHRQQVVNAEAVEDFDTAVLASNRVQNISDRDNWRFLHGMTLVNAGYEENGMVIIRELASPDVPGHLPAHVFLAQQLMDIPEDDPNRETNLELARKHLQRVLDKTSNPKDDSFQIAVRTLPKIMFLQGDIENAISKFEDLSIDTPEIIPELAQYLIDHERYAEADFHITRGVEYLKEKAAINPNVPEIWTLMYQILMVKEDYIDTVQELQYGLTLATNPTIQRLILKLQSDVFVDFSRTFDDVSTRDGFRRKLLPLCQALQRFPRNRNAITDFVDLAVYPSNPEINDWIEEEARDNVAPTVYHLINGVRDTIAGKPATGSMHLKLSFEGDTRAAVVVNDVATIMSLDKSQHEDALKLIDLAIEIWESKALLFYTRGEILMRLDRHAEAVAELEYAAENIENSPRVFEALSECYESLGRTDEAATMKEKAATVSREIEAKMNELREELVKGS